MVLQWVVVVDAIVGFAGRQFRVREKSRILINRIRGEVGERISPEAVHAVFDAGRVVLNPAKTSISATILDHTLGKKQSIYKKIRRHGYQRKRGYRQPSSYIQIDRVSLGKGN